MKMRMGATHFLMKTLPKVATEMALCACTYPLMASSSAGTPTMFKTRVRL